MLYKDGFKLLYYSRHIITCTSWTYIYTEHKCTSIPVTFLVTAFIANFINFIFFEGAGRERFATHEILAVVLSGTYIRPWYY